MLPVPPLLYNAEIIFIYYFHKTAMFLGMQKCILKILQFPFNFMASVKGKFRSLCCCCVFFFFFFIVLVFFSVSLWLLILPLGCSFLHDMQSCLYQEFDVQFRESLPETFPKRLEAFCNLYCFWI